MSTVGWVGLSYTCVCVSVWRGEHMLQKMVRRMAFDMAAPKTKKLISAGEVTHCRSCVCVCVGNWFHGQTLNIFYVIRGNSRLTWHLV